MIWNSIPFMTTVDVLIIAVTVYAIWRCQLIGPSKRPSAPKIGLRWIALGLLLVCLFYFADLASMYVLPAVTSMQEAMEFMGTLHRNLSWLVVLFAMIAISTGFIELRRAQIELTEKNELLADLSSKLAKFLPPQLYNSIFTGTHEGAARAAARRVVPVRGARLRARAPRRALAGPARRDLVPCYRGLPPQPADRRARPRSRLPHRSASNFPSARPAHPHFSL